jgi:3-oxoacyl-(acyl-carrier-protein) synthase/acyl carrier protein
METGLEIAVIGMAGRFPGATDIHKFWDNLKNKVESIAFFSDDDLLEAGVDPLLLENPHYVKAGGIMEDIEYFDATFFGYTPREAEIMEPQVRIFHECTWTALEDAGYDPLSYKGLIGLYAGATPDLGWQARALLSGKSHSLGDFAVSQLTQKEFLTLRVSYKLNLNGPSLFIYTACSTSLVAIHLGYQALLNGECDIALAGGVTVVRLAKSGYIYEEGMIESPDGHCRAFDAGARGLVGGDGVGVVVLRRLRDAVSEGDHIYAVIKGSAINNDGMQKAGFTAPSAKGQAEVIKMAMQMAGAEPESIGYVETHGTGTELGDPVEIEGLKLAFNTNKKGFCGIGSVKTNLGHVDCAAGAAGFIKTVLAINHRFILPSLHFEIPNPVINFVDSPFYVNTMLTPWESNGHPLRAGVSAFGQGGTNAHLILEEFLGTDRHGHSTQGAGEREYRLILLSARTPSALDKIMKNLAHHFRENPLINLADAAHTLQVGRHAYKYRKMFTCSDIHEALGILETADAQKLHSFAVQEENRPVVFLFPGEEGEEGIQAQYKTIGEILYRKNSVFREEMDRCLETLKSKSPSPFIFQYVLAKMLMQCGIKLYAAIGEGSGEAAAECLSGDVSLEEALKSTAKAPAAKLNTSNPMTLSFSHRLQELAKLKNPVFVYFGANIEKIEKILAVPGGFNGHLIHLFRFSPDESAHLHFLMTQIGRLWLYGINLDWERFNLDERRYRIPLPTYPFEGQRYWIDQVPVGMVRGEDSSSSEISQNRHEAKQKKSTASLYSRPELSSEYIPPASEIEAKLAEIWQEFFGFKPIGSQDDFFELGGDSLKIIMLVSMIQQDLNIRVPIPEFFDRPNIKELSLYIRDTTSEALSVSLESTEKREYYQLSAAQKRVFIFHQFNKDSLSYNIPFILDINLEIDLGRMLHAFKRVIKRHETLRTSFIMLPDGPVQVVHDDVPFEIEYLEKSEEEKVPEIINKFIRPFDLGTAPGLRVGLIKIEQAKYVLIMDMYHIISDAFSFDVLSNDFMAFYMGLDLSPMKIQYKDFCQWQKKLYTSGVMDKQKEFWMGRFEDGNVPQLNIPLDFTRPPVRNIDKGDHVAFRLDSALREKMYVVLNQTGTTLPMIMCAAFFVLLFIYTKQEDIVMGMLSSGRSHKDLGNIIGMFVNTLPIRSYPRKNNAFADFLKEIKGIMLNAYENQDYPFDELIVDLGLQGSSTRNPLFDVVFAFNSFDNRRTKEEKTGSNTPDRKMESQDSPVKFAKFDLYLQVFEEDDTLDMLLRYSTQLFKPSTIGKIKKYYIEILEQVMDNSTIKLNDIVLHHDLIAVNPEVAKREKIDFIL